MKNVKKNPSNKQFRNKKRKRREVSGVCLAVKRRNKQEKSSIKYQRQRT